MRAQASLPPGADGRSVRRVKIQGVLRELLAVLGAALVVHGAFAAWMPGWADFDPWFHARYAQMLGSGETPWHGLAMPWMAFSDLADFPVDWSWGWHWLLAPFVPSVIQVSIPRD